jgi:glucan endo-1,3-alpha-glucosidase
MVVARKVFAHYVVGLTFNQTIEQWRHDIASASAAAIDGFALNIGAKDAYTLTALQHAYEAAADSSKDFSLFLSFDFSAQDGWNVDNIANYTNAFKGEKAQFKVDGKPLVSTFEGPNFAESWKEVRKKVDGDIYLMPDWASLAPEGVGKKRDLIDGACVLPLESDVAQCGVWKLTRDSFVRCVAQRGRDAHDDRRGRAVQESARRQDIHDGR